METNTIHSHCMQCIKVNCTFKVRDPSVSCIMISCRLECGRRFHLCKEDEHKLLCGNEKVPCINAAFGCPFILPRNKRAEHLETCPSSVVTCTMEWNRVPLSTRDRQMGATSKWNPELETKLDVALAFSDQRQINCHEWRPCQKQKATKSHPAIPANSGLAASEKKNDGDETLLHAKLPKGETHHFADDSPCGTNHVAQNSPQSFGIQHNEGQIETIEIDDDSDDECVVLKIVRRRVGQGNAKDKAVPMQDDVGEGDSECEVVNIEDSDDDDDDDSDSVVCLTITKEDIKNFAKKVCNIEFRVPCSSIDVRYLSNDIVEQPSTCTVIRFLDNHIVSDIFSNTRGSPCPHSSSDDSNTRYRHKPEKIFTFSCCQFFRRDQFPMHYKNVHSDIHGGLNGWLEHRCPLATYGCTYSTTRLYPSSKGARIIHSKLFNSFGLRPFVVCNDATSSDSDACSNVHMKSQEKSILFELPEEVLVHIFTYLDSFSLCNVAATCRAFHETCTRVLKRKGIISLLWYKENGRWTDEKCWYFTTAFSPVMKWGFMDNPHMSNHIRECPYFERNIRLQPYNLVNDEPRPGVRAAIAKFERQILEAEKK